MRNSIGPRWPACRRIPTCSRSGRRSGSAWTTTWRWEVTTIPHQKRRTLYFQPAGQSAVPIEATAEDQFKIDPIVVFEFDAAKGEMTITRAGQKRVFTKEK